MYSSQTLPPSNPSSHTHNKVTVTRPHTNHDKSAERPRRSRVMYDVRQNTRQDTHDTQPLQAKPSQASLPS